MTITHYRNQLEADGIDSDMVYTVASVVERMHEVFSLLNQDQRIVLQQKFGTRMITELENFGGYTNKQTDLAFRLPVTAGNLTLNEMFEGEST